MSDVGQKRESLFLAGTDGLLSTVVQEAKWRSVSNVARSKAKDLGFSAFERFGGDCGGGKCDREMVVALGRYDSGTDLKRARSMTSHSHNIDTIPKAAFEVHDNRRDEKQWYLSRTLSAIFSSSHG